MLDLKTLTKEQLFSINKRNEFNLDIDSLLILYEKIKNQKIEVQKLQKELNLFSKKKPSETELNHINNLKTQFKKNNNGLIALQKELDEILISTPNILSNDVPIGINANDNQEIKRKGSLKKIVNHYEIPSINPYQDMTGSRFLILKGKIATLERALISFMMEVLLSKGFCEYSVPFLLKEDAFYRSRHLPNDAEGMYKVGKDQWLIPTGEVPLTNLFFQHKFKEIELPYKTCAVTDCFRKEAGAAGKDTRGLIRLHQFKKCEMVIFSTPENSNKMLEFMLEVSSSILEELEIPYRVVNLCSGDIGVRAMKTYDIEIPIGEEWREVSSLSNTGSYQATTLKTRFERGEKKEYVHILNGSGLAIGRTLASLLEVHRDEDILYLPKCLHRFTKFSKINMKKD